MIRPPTFPENRDPDFAHRFHPRAFPATRKTRAHDPSEYSDRLSGRRSLLFRRLGSFPRPSGEADLKATGGGGVRGSTGPRQVTPNPRLFE